MSALSRVPGRDHGLIVVAGHVCIDLFPQFSGPVPLEPGKLFEVGPMPARPGGCVANTGLDLQALGQPVRLVGDAGDDDLGHILKRQIPDVRLLPGQSTSYSIVIEPPGVDRTFWHHPGANAQFDGSGIDLDGAVLLHVGYPSLLLPLIEDKGAALRRLFERAQDAGVKTSLDLAVVDPTSVVAKLNWPAILANVLPVTDLFGPSIDDVESIGFGGDADEFLALGARAVMIKAGSSGLLYRDASNELHAVPPIVDVAGTTGAGDAATAGMLYGLVNDFPVDEALEFAALAAATKVQTQAALPPADELRARPRRYAPLVGRPGHRPVRDGMIAGPAHPV